MEFTVAPDGRTFIKQVGGWGEIKITSGELPGTEVPWESIPFETRSRLLNVTEYNSDNADGEGDNFFNTPGIVGASIDGLTYSGEADSTGVSDFDTFLRTPGSAVKEENTKPNYQFQIKELRKKRLARYGKKTQGGVLRYPAELLTEHTDYLQIDIEKYESTFPPGYIQDTGGSRNYVKGNARQNRAGGTSTNRLSRKPLINAGTILLPIPSQLQDTNNVVYGESRLNGIAAAGVSAVEGGMISFGKALAGEGKIDFTQMKQNVVDKLTAGLGGSEEVALATASDIITKKLAGEAVNIFGANVTINQLLARGSGEILNPNMELLFSDVTIRNFRFSFKLTPRNPKESEQVKLIIRAFKRNMAPQAQAGVQGSGNFFLRTPNIFKIRYRTGNRNHPFLNKFKKCYLTDMQTTYTGEGVYSTYDDRTPVSMQMDLSFKELQPIYDLDYDSKPGNTSVGY